MQPYVALAGLGLALWIPAAAQETGGTRVVVPARNGARPRLVKAEGQTAAITVKTHAGTDVIVEAPDVRPPEAPPPGMHRIGAPPGVNVTEEENVVNIHVPMQARALTITVPVESSIQLKSLNGRIRVDGVHGEVDATCTNCPIELSNISGTIVADTTNGPIRAVMDRVDPSKPISFSSVNGAIDVTLPADVKANLKVKTFNGSIFSDFDMRVPGGQPLTGQGNVNATINGGGVEANFSTLNGRIIIRKK